MKYLTKLRNHFVLVPVDKAPKNVGIICKSFYLQVLNNEIMKSGVFAKLSSSMLCLVLYFKREISI